MDWPKIIRDPVHNIVPFQDNKCDRLLLNLINTKEFQRLRRIKQLGLSQLVFPGADHSRFAHSIGVMHVARAFLERIEIICSKSVTEQQVIVVLAAALLHDVGHGPFSHAFEKITGDNHEKRTLEIISDPSTEVHQALAHFSSELNLPESLKVFFDEDREERPTDGVDIPAYLTQIVTSQLDADRFDYLFRDSLSTGTDYGRFDMDWLIQHLHVDKEKQRFFLSHKALFAAESYVFARYHMYRSVYFHKTTRAAEVMLRLLFKRYKACLDDTDDDEKKKGIVPDAPAACVRAFGGKLDLEEYLQLDDHTLTEFAKACMRSSDEVLKMLAEGLLNRKLFKATDVSDSKSYGVTCYSEKAKEIIEADGFDVEHAFAHDAPSDTAYKLYNPDAETPATQIYIVGIDGRQVELSRMAESVHSLTKKYQLMRYYFPADVRDRIQAEAEPLLIKE